MILLYNFKSIIINLPYHIIVQLLSVSENDKAAINDDVLSMLGKSVEAN